MCVSISLFQPKWVPKMRQEAPKRGSDANGQRYDNPSKGRAVATLNNQSNFSLCLDHSIKLDSFQVVYQVV